MLDTVLTLLNHPLVEYKKQPAQYEAGEIASDLILGTSGIIWNFATFFLHIIMMALGLQKDDRTPDEMPGYQDYDSKHHSAMMIHPINDEELKKIREERGEFEIYDN